ncbi:hypothetical protein V6N13_020569 [Hibiscus sabdariffa]
MPQVPLVPTLECLSSPLALENQRFSKHGRSNARSMIGLDENGVSSETCCARMVTGDIGSDSNFDNIFDLTPDKVIDICPSNETVKDKAAQMLAFAGASGSRFSVLNADDMEYVHAESTEGATTGSDLVMKTTNLTSVASPAPAITQSAEVVKSAGYLASNPPKKSLTLKGSAEQAMAIPMVPGNSVKVVEHDSTGKFSEHRAVSILEQDHEMNFREGIQSAMKEPNPNFPQDRIGWGLSSNNHFTCFGTSGFNALMLCSGIKLRSGARSLLVTDGLRTPHEKLLSRDRPSRLVIWDNNRHPYIGYLHRLESDCAEAIKLIHHDDHLGSSLAIVLYIREFYKKDWCLSCTCINQNNNRVVDALATTVNTSDFRCSSLKTHQSLCGLYFRRTCYLFLLQINFGMMYFASMCTLFSH